MAKWDKPGIGPENGPGGGQPHPLGPRGLSTGGNISPYTNPPPTGIRPPPPIGITPPPPTGIRPLPETNPIYGNDINGPGVRGDSITGIGVLGTNSQNGTGVMGTSTNGVGVFGSGSFAAGYFEGNVNVTGDIYVSGKAYVTVDIELTGGDCAEHFDTTEAQELEPGTVVVIDQKGALRESRDAYDKKVAGVVSGAGEYKPAIVLDRRASDKSRTLVALVGKVYCKVDAQYAPIEVGDLLTASATPGHAMKANEPGRAFGAVIGKALRPLETGRGLIPILIALQ